MSTNGKTYFESGREIPITKSTDIVIAGGGSAGFSAAVAAARRGVRTLVVEKEYAMGGIMTTGLMAKVAIEPYMQGIPTEVIMRLGKERMAIPPLAFPPLCPASLMTEVPVDPEASKKVLEEMLLEANAEVLYGTMVVGAIKAGNEIRGVVVENKNGRQAIEAKVFIDATGDGDLSVQAGAEFRMGRDGDGMCSASTLMFRIGGVDMEALLAHLDRHPEDLRRNEHTLSPKFIRECVFGTPPIYAHIGGFNGTIARADRERPFTDWERRILTVRNGILFMNLPHPGQVLVNTSRIMDRNGLDAWDVTWGMLEGRRQCWFIYEFLKKHVPGFEKSFLMDTASTLGVRETRRIVGDYIHTVDDFRKRVKFDDAILKNTDSVEFHNPTGNGTAFERYKVGEYEEISYRSILVKGFSNLMAIGRCFSADQLALSCNRSIGFCFSMGQAAGTAAALAVERAVGLREVPVKELQDLVYPAKRRT